MFISYCDVCKKKEETRKVLIVMKMPDYGCGLKEYDMCKKCANKYDNMQGELGEMFMKYHGNIRVEVGNGLQEKQNGGNKYGRKHSD